VCLETRLLHQEFTQLAALVQQQQHQHSQSQSQSQADVFSLSPEPSQSFAPDPALICNLTVQHLSTRRNKRCLLAYHAHRLDTLKHLFWSSSSGSLAHLLAPSSSFSSSAPTEPSSTSTVNLNAPESNVDTRSKLSPHEVDFLRSYNDLILDYKSEYIDAFDFSAGVSVPPKELFVSVKVVRECGVVWTESMGAMDFGRKGQRFLVRRGDVERLIVQGYLEEV
jgi:GINS complex subunit 1